MVNVKYWESKMSTFERFTKGLICFVCIMAKVLINGLDVGNPLFLKANDHSNVVVVSIKLTGNDNYKMWSNFMKIALKVLSWIRSSLSPELYLGQVYYGTAFVDWEELQETYDKMNGYVIFNVIHKFWGLKQGQPETDESPAVPERIVPETFSNISPKNKAHYDVEAEAIHLNLTGIGDDIYLTIARNANPLALVAAAQQYPDTYYHPPKSHRSYAPPEKTSSSYRTHATTRNKGKKIAKPITPPSKSASKEDSDPEQAQRDKDMHFAKECRKPKRAKDYTYHKEKMLLCKQAEKGVPLCAKQTNWLDDTDEELDEQELEALTVSWQKFRRQHSEQPESINDTYVVEKDDNNIIPDSSYMCNNNNQAEQNVEVCDDERVVLANLTVNLKLDTDENKKIQKQLKKANATFAHELKERKSKLIERCKGKSVDAKFDKPYVVRQPNAQMIPKPSVLGKPTPFSYSLERKNFTMKKSVTKTNVSEGLSRPVTTQSLPRTIRKSIRNTNVIKPEMYQIDIRTRQSRASQLPQTSRNTNPRVFTSIGVIHRTSVSRPQLKITQIKEKVMQNNSQVKFKKTQVEDHHRIFSIFNKTKSVTACNDSVLNVNVVCATCRKCLNHNLFSVGQFCDADLNVAFRKSTCFVRDLQGNDLLTVESDSSPHAHADKTNGLNGVYQPIMNNILAKDPLLDVKDAFNVVSREEFHRGLHPGFRSKVKHVAFVMKFNNFMGNDFKRGFNNANKDDIQCASFDHDHYPEAACAHHEDHMMHDNVQLDHIVDSHTDYTSDSNIILYDQYVKDNEVPVVHSDVSSVPIDDFMMIYDDMCEPHDQSISYPSRNTAVQISLTAELATYKEHVELYEQRAKFELTEREQKINEQLRIVIPDHNFKEETLKRELHSIKLQLLLPSITTSQWSKKFLF
uniref:Retrotransposon Copia-like N-terminal domain-containing protein n=1 Tax=Tanacetum cinerariifolium TaxID=118510 RepID=A0A6L2JD78_TANCI|nr:hypothetical protein [Tanacetum cinerariifolium]